MTAYIAFLRAVNVGGTGKLPMQDLRDLCAAISFQNVSTYIASGNVIFTSNMTAAMVKNTLEEKLRSHTGKEIAVIVCTPTYLQTVLNSNPFPNAKPSFTIVTLFGKSVNSDVLVGVTGQFDEKIVPGKKELYVLYENGIGASKLKIPAAKVGTSRNINTIRKIVALCAAL